MSPRRLPALTLRASGTGILSAIGLAVGLLLASGWLALDNLRAVVHAEQLGDRIAAAELATEKLLSTLKDTEIGQRGYLLTGDTVFLRFYIADLARLALNISQPSDASLGDSGRQWHIDHINGMIRAKITELAAALVPVMLQPEASPYERRAVAAPAGLDAIRDEVNVLQADATVRLAAARANGRSMRHSVPVAWLRGVAVALLCWAALATVLRSTRHRLGTDQSHLQRFSRAFGLTQGMMRDLDGRIIFWSHGAARLYGYDQRAALGRISHDLLDTAFPQPLPDIGAALLATGYWQGELTHHRPDGDPVHILSHWSLHRGETGEADAVIVVDDDITEIKQAALALRQSEMKLQLALDASDQGVWRWEVGQDGFEFDWDARCKALFGFRPDQRVDYASWAAAVHVEDREMAEASLSQVLDPANSHDDFLCTYRAVSPDGRICWLACQGAAVFEPDPAAPAQRRIVRVLGTIQDVSAARHAERELERTTALLRTIMETAAGLIYAKDRQGCLLAANDAVLAMLGKHWEDVEGHTDGEYFSDPKQAAAVMRSDQDVMQRGQIQRVEELLSGDDGCARTWLSTKAPMRDGNGQVVGLVGVSVDITERKQAEDRMQLMINELNHRVKNTLATVQAFMWQTLRGVDPTVRRNLDGRLLAVAAAHDVLKTEHWQGAELDHVVTSALELFGGRDSGRFQVSGPAVLLSPRAVLALAMGLHELATNALRYGALSAAAGRVEIRWDIIEGERPMLRLMWIEQAGPAVLPPVLRGFGTRLVERSLAQDLCGRAWIGFESPEGVICVIEAPLAEVMMAASVLPMPAVGTV